MDKQSPIHTLFRKYLDGTYSTEELDTLLTHFEIEEDDAVLTDRILDELQLEIDPKRQPEIKRLADGIGQRIFDKVQVPGRRYISVWSRVAAAIVVIGLIGAGLLYYQNRNNTVEETALSNRYEDEVMPGGMRATLVIDDGSEVRLDQQQTGIVVSENLTYSDGTAVGIKATKYATLKTPRGGQYRVELADGTVVWLNAASSLKYPLAFDGDQRDVTLDGEAYFEVSHQIKKPFIVHSQGQQVTVLGTTFNISTYAGTGVTTLLEGKVEIKNIASAQKKMLAPGQQAVVSNSTIQIQTLPDVSDYAAWKDGYYIRTGVTLSEVLPELERWYDVAFVIDQQTTTRAYIALDRNAKLSTVLEALTLNYGVKFKVEGRRVIVME
jgi:transmembrane sensor